MSEGKPEMANRLFPTRYKNPIGKYLSWAAGAEKLSCVLASIPQAAEIELCFSESWPKYHQGKWPGEFSVIEAEYNRYRNMHMTGIWAEPRWTLRVRPVPRERKAEINAALESEGFARLAEWLNKETRISGREGHVRLVISWNTETGRLAFTTSGLAVPEVTTDASARRRLNEDPEPET